MTQTLDPALDHYQSGLASGDPIAEILAGLDERPGELDPADLAALDQFHAGGVAATLKLARLLDAPEGARVLDAGSGLGGTARVIAARFGYDVTGVDLTPSYVDLAQRLVAKTGQTSRVRFEVGDLLALPFEAARFDAAYSQHVAMNIADRDGLYHELRRVLKTGGAFVFHDVLAAHGESPVYPTPWAEDAGRSFLLDEDQTVAVLQRSQLRLDSWEDVSAEAIAAIASLRGASPSGPSLGAIMGPRFSEMTRNYATNLSEGRLRVVIARATAI